MTRWLLYFGYLVFISGMDIANSASIINATNDDGTSEALQTLPQQRTVKVFAHINANATGLATRESRRSGLFSDVCTTTDGIAGTCVSRFSCIRQGGTPKGFCGTYGTYVCCETSLTCGSVTRTKRTVITSPSTFTSTTCTYTIERYSANVCQVLVEFRLFELTQPMLDNSMRLQCTDFMRIDGMVLCGVNTGQHLYIHLSGTTNLNTLNLEFNLPSRSANNRYNLIITQLECPAVKNQLTLQNSLTSFLNKNYAQDFRTIFSTHNSDIDMIAPHGCNQYYRESTGTIRSFNFQQATNSLYLPNMNYVICVKPTATSVSIRYTATSFSLSSVDPLSPGVDENCRATVMTSGRREDFLMIPNSSELADPTFQSTYYCGIYLTQTPSIIGLPPYIMYFQSDDITDNTETGFSINYAVV